MAVNPEQQMVGRITEGLDNAEVHSASTKYRKPISVRAVDYYQNFWRQSQHHIGESV